MPKHILSKFSNSYDYEKKKSNYYDEVTQVSYKDNKLEKMLVTTGRTSKSTNTIENSDPDEFKCYTLTIKTATVENSDPDEFSIKDSTRLTFTLENSDEDELCMSGYSIETRVLESSDPDEFIS
ncbi:hypothetical protein [Clostridium sp.]|uniref:hypothetical protein n=1 Tax=Clostridium sp. TaxID=1506 RepID=UPI0026197F44|nr:hypothetical protein [Clostridium sp.]